MINQQKVEIAAQFYDARKTMIILLGVEKFKARVEEVRPILKKVMAEHKKTDMEATLMLLKGIGDDGMQIVMLLATTCEIMEPSL
jgi:hypothetical protein